MPPTPGDQAHPLSHDEPIDLVALDAWIDDRLPGRGSPLAAERIGFGIGIANALYYLRRGDHEWVLRRPPAVKNHPTASDTSREWRILRALEGTPVPHPAPLLFCDDPSVIGSTFMIMERIHGFTPGGGLPPPFDTDPGAQRDLAMAYVDGLVELAGVDWQARGLDGLGKPDGFLERQVGRWLGQLDGYRTRTLPDETFLCEWLNANRPTMSPAGILHGDYSPFNVMVAHRPPARLAAVVDWDTGTIGDPLLDIGHLLSRWAEPGEVPVIPYGGAAAPGSPSRREMAARYEARTGRDVSAIAYYEVLALFKLGVILEGTYARARAAGDPAGRDPEGGPAPVLFRHAAERARGVWT